MKIVAISLFPDFFNVALKMGLLGQSLEKGQVEITCIDLRAFGKGVHRSVDDKPYGGGDGMLMQAEPLALAMQEALGSLSVGSSSFASGGPSKNVRKIYLSPQGSRLDHQKVKELLQYENLVLVCGRYAGVDERYLNAAIDEEISIGDFVLSGGEAAALVLIEALCRQMPGFMNNSKSIEEDSFVCGLLEAPQYTRPAVWQGIEVPKTLMSGDHQAIALWKQSMSLLVTYLKRPDLFHAFLEKSPLSKEARQMVLRFFKDNAEVQSWIKVKQLSEEALRDFLKFLQP